MKLIELFFKYKKDGILKTIEEINSAEELITEFIKIKNEQLTNARIALKKLIVTQEKVKEAIAEKRHSQVHNEDHSLIELKNNNKPKAFRMLKIALDSEKAAVTLEGKLQKITQSITDVSYDIETIRTEADELYDAQQYIVSTNKHQSAEGLKSTTYAEYKSPFASISAKKVDEILHIHELAFESEHYSIDDKLNYDGIESQLELIKAKFKA